MNVLICLSKKKSSSIYADVRSHTEKKINMYMDLVFNSKKKSPMSSCVNDYRIEKLNKLPQLTP